MIFMNPESLSFIVSTVPCIVTDCFSFMDLKYVTFHFGKIITVIYFVLRVIPCVIVGCTFSFIVKRFLFIINRFMCIFLYLFIIFLYNGYLIISMFYIYY